MHDIIDETSYEFTVITQPTVEIEFPMLGGIGELKLDYAHYKQSGCKYFACDDGENWSKDDNKRIVSEETRATLASKIKPVDETIPYSRYSPFSLHYHGPQLAGVDEANGTIGNINYETPLSDLRTNKSTRLFQI